MTVDFGELIAKAVALKNTTLPFNLNTVYTILKADGKSEQIKGSDYLASHPYVWEFLKFSDNNGQNMKSESGFFKYFIQATDQFGYKYQNTSDGRISDFIDNLDILKVQVAIDTDNKYPPKWSIKTRPYRIKSGLITSSGFIMNLLLGTPTDLTTTQRKFAEFQHRAHYAFHAAGMVHRYIKLLNERRPLH